jgi:hypothetical protein
MADAARSETGVLRDRGARAQNRSGERHRISHVCHVAKRDWHQARATLPDGTVNPHLLFLPDSRYFDPGVAMPSPFDGVGQYMKPSKRSTPRYIELEQQAQTAETKGAVEQREREREHSRLMEYRKRLGVDGPARHPEHLKHYEARPRPRFVPYVVRSNPYRDEQVKWRPPVEEPVEPEYISTADAVEVPPPPMLRAASESADRQRRVVAYDDGDPFPFPVRILPPPPSDVGAPPLEFFGPSGLTVVHTAAKVILFTPDRSRVYQVMCGAPHDGWSTVPLRGDPPDGGCTLVPMGDSHVLALTRGERCWALTLQSMTWTSLLIPNYRLRDNCTFAHSVGDGTDIYIRSSSQHFVVAFRRYVVHDADMVLPGDEMIDIKRYRLYAAKARELRSNAVEDTLVAVPGAPHLASRPPRRRAPRAMNTRGSSGTSRAG